MKGRHPRVSHLRASRYGGQGEAREPHERRGGWGPRPSTCARGALSLVEGRERPPTRGALRRGLAAALAEAEVCKGVRGTKSPGAK